MKVRGENGFGLRCLPAGVTKKYLCVVNSLPKFFSFILPLFWGTTEQTSFVGLRGEPNSRCHVYQVLGHALMSVRPHLWLFGVGPDNSVLREVDFFLTFRDPYLIMPRESKGVF